MNAEILHLRALTRLPTRRDRGARFLVEDELQDLIVRFLAPHLRAGESVTAIQDRARGLQVEIDATALQDAWRRRLTGGGAWDDEDDDLLRLDAILGALAQFERVAGPPPVTVQAIVLARPLPRPSRRPSPTPGTSSGAPCSPSASAMTPGSRPCAA